MENFFVDITRKIKITAEDIDDIMCSALEGGITYWCCKAEIVGEYLGECASEQISRGGVLKLYDSVEDTVYSLTLSDVIKGIKLALQENYYADYGWCDGETLDTCQVDADVADCIIQFALFDDVVYG